MSKIYFRYASMNSGKSTSLIQVAFNYTERDQNVIILKPTIDTKSDFVMSRIGVKREVDVHISPSTNIKKEVSTIRENKNVNCILVDEAQFLSPVQVDQLFEIAVKEDIPVLCYGIRTDFQTHAFPGSARLMEVAHSIEEMKTICRCGSKAIFNARKVDGTFVRTGNQVAIDGEVEYESLCGLCYYKEVGEISAK